jgi:hypothetical protein
MVNNLKEETQKLVFDLKDNMNKPLNELIENTNKQMNEIKHTIQDMKEERYENPEKQSIQNKQLNIPNKYLN